MLKSKHVKEILVGCMLSIQVIIMTLSYANIVFAKYLHAELLQGITLGLLGTILFVFTGVFFSKLKNGVYMTRGTYAIIAAGMVGHFAAQYGINAPGATNTIFVMLALMSLILGVSFYLLGVFRLGDVTGFLPFPVVCGFFICVAFLLIKSGINMMMPADFSWTMDKLPMLFSSNNIWSWILSFLLALGLQVTTMKIKSKYTFLVYMAGLFVLIYGYIFFSGMSFSSAQKQGVFLGPFAQQNIVNLPKIYSLSRVNWHFILSQYDNFFIMVMLSTIAFVFGLSGHELKLKSPVNMNHELRTGGIGNVLCGFFGALGGYHDMNASEQHSKFGGTSKLSLISLGVVCLLVLFFGMSTIALVPKIIVSVVILNIGLGFIYTWLFRYRGFFNILQYAIIFLIVGLMLGFGLIFGVLLGVLISIVIFLYRYHQSGIIKSSKTGNEISSQVVRSQPEVNVLDQYGNHIQIYILKGFLFFGNIELLIKQVRQLIRDSLSQTESYIIFDFARVYGRDESVYIALLRLFRLCHQANLKCIISGVEKEMSKHLKKTFEVENESVIYQSYNNLEEALEYCENGVLGQYGNASVPAFNSLEDMLSVVLKNVEQTQQFKSYLTKLTYQDGEIVCRQGDHSDGIYFIYSGQVEVCISIHDGSKIRLCKIGSGTITGEVSYYTDTPRNATIKSLGQSILYGLSREKFNELSQALPNLAIEIHKNIARTLSEKLNNTNKLVKVLQI